MFAVINVVEEQKVVWNVNEETEYFRTIEH